MPKEKKKSLLAQSLLPQALPLNLDQSASLTCSGRIFTAAPTARGSSPAPGNPLLSFEMVSAASSIDLSRVTASFTSLLADIGAAPWISRLSCPTSSKHSLSSVLASVANAPCWTESDVGLVCDNENAYVVNVGLDFDVGLNMDDYVCVVDIDVVGRNFNGSTVVQEPILYAPYLFILMLMRTYVIL